MSNASIRDLGEEYERLKREHTSQQTSSSTDSTWQTSTPFSTSAPPISTHATCSASEPESLELESRYISFTQLVESLRELGYSITSLESLKTYARALDEEEKKLMREIQERQRRLKIIRAAKRLLKIMGI